MNILVYVCNTYFLKVQKVLTSIEYLPTYILIELTLVGMWSGVVESQKIRSQNSGTLQKGEFFFISLSQNQI